MSFRFRRRTMSSSTAETTLLPFSYSYMHSSIVGGNNYPPMNESALAMVGYTTFRWGGGISTCDPWSSLTSTVTCWSATLLTLRADLSSPPRK
jgi:hypothetical protein